MKKNTLSIIVSIIFIGLFLSAKNRWLSNLRVTDRPLSQSRPRAYNVPYGHVSRANVHNSISVEFLEAACAVEDTLQAAKTFASLTADLMQQMKYYHLLGNQGMTDQELANQARNAYQKISNSLSDDQLPFTIEILTCFELIDRINLLKEKHEYLGRDGSVSKE